MACGREIDFFNVKAKPAGKLLHCAAQVAYVMLDMLPFTVFTPTYNRAHTLQRVYDSLCRQPSQMFEWLVVDDGSTDNTATLLSELKQTASFPIRVISQPNGGKHRAHNAAVKVAEGELTIILDSDDEMVTGALENIWEEWLSIPIEARETYSGVIGNCVDESGEVHGIPFPKTRMDGRFFELEPSGVMIGEKLPCYRTDILRRFPMPERSGCNEYVMEGIVWVRIGESYQVRCINTAVRVYHKDVSDAMSVMNSHEAHKRGAWGKMLYSATVLNLYPEYFPRYLGFFLKQGACMSLFGFHAGYGLKEQFAQLQGTIPKVLLLSGLPVGTVLFVLDRIRHNE